jgi:hypothetical protein
MPQLHIDKSEERGAVAINTGDGWEELSPDAAREMAAGFEEQVENDDRPDTAGVRTFIEKLRQFADEVDDA